MKGGATPGQKWLDNLPAYVSGMTGLGVVEGTVAGVTNPLVEISDTNAIFAATSGAGKVWTFRTETRSLEIVNVADVATLVVAINDLAGLELTPSGRYDIAAALPLVKFRITIG